MNIHIALSPNNMALDTLEALWQIVWPGNWRSWQKGNATTTLEQKFAQYFGMEKAFSIDSGRAALFVILKGMDLEKNDEIILQSFTCMVVVNSIVWNGLKPVYVDIDPSTYNLDPAKLEAAITPRTKAIMIQHTFGIPAEITKIQKICKKYGILLIEDCAHAMGAEYKGQKVGTFGEVSFYSLGRSKVISCVSGGMILVKDEALAEKIEHQIAKLPVVSKKVIFKNLLHPIASSVAKLAYNFFGLGKVILVVLQRMKILTMEVEKHEKQGVFVAPFPARLPNALAKVALHQFKKLDEFNAKRRKIVEYYYEMLHRHGNLKMLNPADFAGAIFLRFPLQMAKRNKILVQGKSQGIILGDWYSVAIAPADIDHSKTFYDAADCPNTEAVCGRIINLPTFPGLKKKQLESIVKLF